MFEPLDFPSCFGCGALLFGLRLADQGISLPIAQFESRLKRMNARPLVVVVGSINMDLVIRCDKLPRPGETKLATSLQELCGGKGANQAVAAARAGGSVSMIGCVGDDAFANRLISNLDKEGIDTTTIQHISNCSSGVAVVAVEEIGQNSILVVPGANARLTPVLVQQHKALIQSADIVLLQLEIPHETVAEVIRLANEAGVRVVLDPAPAPTTWPGAFSANQYTNGIGQASEPVINGISLFCPNQTEASTLTGMPVDNFDQAEAAAKKLLGQGIHAVAITMAEQGTLLVDQNQTQCIEPFLVTPVDTTAAGDAFAGALAIRWVESNDLLQSLSFANAAGAIAVTRHGAQQAMATRDEIDQFIAQRTTT
ncbi:MAG: ribokinase [Pirellulales bacterium]